MSLATFLALSTSAACTGCSGPTPYVRNADPQLQAGATAVAASAPPMSVGDSAITDAHGIASRGATWQGTDGADRLGAPLRLVVFGDTGTGTDAQAQVAQGLTRHCAGEGCDLAILLGDIVYEDGITSIDDPLRIERFEQPYKALAAPIWLVLGNHDYRGDVEAWVTAYGGSIKRAIDAHLPARFYTFSVGDVRFVVLDTNRLDAAQGRWLDGVLHESRAANDRWVVAVGHHPWRSFGWHGHASPGDARFLATHLCNRVDFFVAGHEHDKQVIDPICGVNLIVAGTGAKLRSVDRGEGTRFARASLGFGRFVFGGDVATVTMHAADGTTEYQRSFQRRRAPIGSAGDGADDPDCAGVVCGADDRCESACVADPDCVGDSASTANRRACSCDNAPGVCELRAAEKACGCDAACSAGVAPCMADRHCDPLCNSDPDCR